MSQVKITCSIADFVRLSLELITLNTLNYNNFTDTMKRDYTAIDIEAMDLLLGASKRFKVVLALLNKLQTDGNYNQFKTILMAFIDNADIYDLSFYAQIILSGINWKEMLERENVIKMKNVSSDEGFKLVYRMLQVGKHLNKKVNEAFGDKIIHGVLIPV